MCSSQILTLSSQYYSTNCFLLSCTFFSNIQQRIFSQRITTYWIFPPFFFFCTILCKPQRQLCGKVPVDQQFLVTFLPRSDTPFELLQVVLTMSTCRNALSC